MADREYNVIYRAIADYTNIVTESAKAEAATKRLGDAHGATADKVVAGETKVNKTLDEHIKRNKQLAASETEVAKATEAHRRAERALAEDFKQFHGQSSGFTVDPAKVRAQSTVLAQLRNDLRDAGKDAEHFAGQISIAFNKIEEAQRRIASAQSKLKSSGDLRPGPGMANLQREIEQHQRSVTDLNRQLAEAERRHTELRARTRVTLTRPAVTATPTAVPDTADIQRAHAAIEAARRGLVEDEAALKRHVDKITRRYGARSAESATTHGAGADLSANVSASRAALQRAEREHAVLSAKPVAPAAAPQTPVPATPASGKSPQELTNETAARMRAEAEQQRQAFKADPQKVLAEHTARQRAEQEAEQQRAAVRAVQDQQIADAQAKRDADPLRWHSQRKLAASGVRPGMVFHPGTDRQAIVRDARMRRDKVSVELEGGKKLSYKPSTEIPVAIPPDPNKLESEIVQRRIQVRAKVEDLVKTYGADRDKWNNIVRSALINQEQALHRAEQALTSVDPKRLEGINRREEYTKEVAARNAAAKAATEGKSILPQFRDQLSADHALRRLVEKPGLAGLPDKGAVLPGWRDQLNNLDTRLRYGPARVGSRTQYYEPMVRHLQGMLGHLEKYGGGVEAQNTLRGALNVYRPMATVRGKQPPDPYGPAPLPKAPSPIEEKATAAEVKKQVVEVLSDEAFINRIQRLRPFTEMGPNYNRGVADSLTSANRLRSSGNGSGLGFLLEAETAAGIRPREDLARHRAGEHVGEPWAEGSQELLRFQLERARTSLAQATDSTTRGFGADRDNWRDDDKRRIEALEKRVADAEKAAHAAQAEPTGQRSPAGTHPAAAGRARAAGRDDTDALVQEVLAKFEARPGVDETNYIRAREYHMPREIGAARDKLKRQEAWLQDEIRRYGDHPQSTIKADAPRIQQEHAEQRKQIEHSERTLAALRQWMAQRGVPPQTDADYGGSRYRRTAKLLGGEPETRSDRRFQAWRERQEKRALTPPPTAQEKAEKRRVEKEMRDRVAASTADAPKTKPLTGEQISLMGVHPAALEQAQHFLKAQRNRQDTASARMLGGAIPHARDTSPELRQMMAQAHLNVKAEDRQLAARQRDRAADEWAARWAARGLPAPEHAPGGPRALTGGTQAASRRVQADELHVKQLSGEQVSLLGVHRDALAQAQQFFTRDAHKDRDTARMLGETIPHARSAHREPPPADSAEFGERVTAAAGEAKRSRATTGSAEERREQAAREKREDDRRARQEKMADDRASRQAAEEDRRSAARDKREDDRTTRRFAEARKAQEDADKRADARQSRRTAEARKAWADFEKRQDDHHNRMRQGPPPPRRSAGRGRTWEQYEDERLHRMGGRRPTRSHVDDSHVHVDRLAGAEDRLTSAARRATAALHAQHGITGLKVGSVRNLHAAEERLTAGSHALADGVRQAVAAHAQHRAALGAGTGPLTGDIFDPLRRRPVAAIGRRRATFDGDFRPGGHGGSHGFGREGFVNFRPATAGGADAAGGTGFFARLGALFGNLRDRLNATFSGLRGRFDGLRLPHPDLGGVRLPRLTFPRLAGLRMPSFAGLGGMRLPGFNIPGLSGLQLPNLGRLLGPLRNYLGRYGAAGRRRGDGFLEGELLNEDEYQARRSQRPRGYRGARRNDQRYTGRRRFEGPQEPTVDYAGRHRTDSAGLRDILQTVGYLGRNAFRRQAGPGFLGREVPEPGPGLSARLRGFAGRYRYAGRRRGEGFLTGELLDPEVPFAGGGRPHTAGPGDPLLGHRGGVGGALGGAFGREDARGRFARLFDRYRYAGARRRDDEDYVGRRRDAGTSRLRDIFQTAGYLGRNVLRRQAGPGFLGRDVPPPGEGLAGYLRRYRYTGRRRGEGFLDGELLDPVAQSRRVRPHGPGRPQIGPGGLLAIGSGPGGRGMFGDAESAAGRMRNVFTRLGESLRGASTTAQMFGHHLRQSTAVSSVVDRLRAGYERLRQSLRGASTTAQLFGHHLRNSTLVTGTVGRMRAAYDRVRFTVQGLGRVARFLGEEVRKSDPLASAVGRLGNAYRTLSGHIQGVGRVARFLGQEFVKTTHLDTAFHRIGQVGEKAFNRVRESATKLAGTVRRHVSGALRRFSSDAGGVLFGGGGGRGRGPGGGRGGSSGWSLGPKEDRGPGRVIQAAYVGFKGVGDAAAGALNGLFRSFRRFIAIGVLLVTVLGPVVATLGAVGAAAVGVAGAVGSMAGAVLALPGLFGAAAAAVGALAIALSPMAAVFKAFSAHQDAVRKGSLQLAASQRLAANAQRNAQHSYEVASRGIQQAQFQEKRAQVALNEARREAARNLQDLRNQLDRMGLDEEGAILAVRRAEAEYRKTMADGNATQLDRLESLHGVKEAEFDLRDVRLKNKRLVEDAAIAEKRGVEGNLSVVDARNAAEQATVAVSDAVFQLAEAQRNLTQTMKESAAGGTEAYRTYMALQDELNKLGPKTRQFAQSMLDAGDLYHNFIKRVGDSFFAPLIKQTDKIKAQFAGGGGISKLLEGAGAAMGDVASKAVDMITAWDKSGDLGKITDLNTKLINNFGDAALSVADAFKDITIAAGPFTTWISEAVKGLAQDFADWAKAGRGDGSIAAFLDDTKRHLQTLGDIIGNLWTWFKGMYTASKGFTDWILAGIDDASKRWAEFGKAAGEGKNGFSAYLEQSKPLLKDIWGMFQAIGDAFSKIAADPENIKEAQRVLGQLSDTVLPALVKLARELSQSRAVSTLVELIGSLLDSIATFLEKGGTLPITAFLDGMLLFFGGIAKLASSLPGVPEALTAIGIALGGLAAASVAAKFLGLFKLVSALRWIRANKGGLFTGLLDKIIGPKGTGGTGGVGTYTGQLTEIIALLEKIAVGTRIGTGAGAAGAAGAGAAGAGAAGGAAGAGAAGAGAGGAAAGAGLGAAEGAAAVGGAGILSKLGGAAKVLGRFAGPIGMILTGLQVWNRYQEDAKNVEDTQNRLKDNLMKVGEAYRTGGDNAVTSLERTDGAVRDQMDLLRKAGVTAKDAGDAIGGDKGSQSRIKNALRGHMKDLDKEFSEIKKRGKWSNVLSDIFGEGTADSKRSKAISNEIRATKDLLPELEKEWAKQKLLEDAERKLREEEERRNTALREKGLPTTQAFKDAMDALNSTTSTAAEKSSALRTAWDELYGGGVAAEMSHLDFLDKLTEYQQTQEENRKKGGKGGVDLSDKTAATRNNRRQLAELLDANKELFLKERDAANGDPAAEAAAKKRYEDRQAQIVGVTNKVQQSKTQVQDLINLVGTVDDVEHKVRMGADIQPAIDGVNTAVQWAATAQDRINQILAEGSLPANWRGKTPSAMSWDAQHPSGSGSSKSGSQPSHTGPGVRRRHAQSGGWVDGVYDGRPDTKAHMLTVGEYVMRRRVGEKPHGKRFLDDVNNERIDPAMFYGGLNDAAKAINMPAARMLAPSVSATTVNNTNTRNAGLNLSIGAINNPVREPSSRSLRRSLAGVAYLTDR